MDCTGIDRLIADYGLHDGEVPVQLWGVLRALNVVVTLDPALPTRGLLITDSAGAMILIRATLSRDWWRALIAHELSHLVTGEVDSMGQAAARSNKQEARIWRAAIRLLVPPWAVREYQTIERIARECVVPEDLLWRYWRN